MAGSPHIALVMGAEYGVLALVITPLYRRMFEAQARMEAQVQAASTPGGAAPDVFGPLLDMYAALGWVMLLAMPLGMFLTALMLSWVGEVLQGRAPTAGALARVALGRTPALLGTMVVTLLLFLVGFVLCILPGLALAVMLSLAWPAAVVGRAGPFDAVSRSWELVRAHLGPMLLVVLVAAGVLMGAGLVSNIFTMLGKPLGVTGLVAGSIVGQVMMGAVSVFPYALLTAAFLRLSAARGVGAGVQEPLPAPVVALR